MQQQSVPSTAAQSEAPVTQKLPYSRPMLNFVPLNLEESVSGRKKSSTGFGPLSCC